MLFNYKFRMFYRIYIHMCFLAIYILLNVAKVIINIKNI